MSKLITYHSFLIPTFNVVLGSKRRKYFSSGPIVARKSFFFSSSSSTPSARFSGPGAFFFSAFFYRALAPRISLIVCVPAGGTNDNEKYIPGKNDKFIHKQKTVHRCGRVLFHHRELPGRKTRRPTRPPQKKSKDCAATCPPSHSGTIRYITVNSQYISQYYIIYYFFSAVLMKPYI